MAALGCSNSESLGENKKFSASEMKNNFLKNDYKSKTFHWQQVLL